MLFSVWQQLAPRCIFLSFQSLLLSVITTNSPHWCPPASFSLKFLAACCCCMTSVIDICLSNFPSCGNHVEWHGVQFPFFSRPFFCRSRFLGSFNGLENFTAKFPCRILLFPGLTWILRTFYRDCPSCTHFLGLHQQHDFKNRQCDKRHIQFFMTAIK